MSRIALIDGIATEAQQITRELDSLADRAFQLQRHALALQQKDSKGASDKSVGTDNGVTSGSSFKLDRAQRLQPFHYLPFNRKLNWKKIRALNLDRLVREADSRTLMDLFADVAQADLEGESSFNLTESNLIKLVKCCQMMLQFVQHSSVSARERGLRRGSFSPHILPSHRRSNRCRCSTSRRRMLMASKPS